MMQRKGRKFAACLFAAVWWGIFYPELCFTEQTCEAVTAEETGMDGVPGEIEAVKVWDASGDEIVIGSRFLEWCEEKLASRAD